MKRILFALLLLLLLTAAAVPSFAATCTTKAIPESDHTKTFATLTLPAGESTPIFYVPAANVTASLVFWYSNFTLGQPANTILLAMYHLVPKTGGSFNGTHQVLIAGAVTNAQRGIPNNFALSTPMHTGELWAVHADNKSGGPAVVALSVLVRECLP